MGTLIEQPGAATATAPAAVDGAQRTSVDAPALVEEALDSFEELIAELRVAQSLRELLTVHVSEARAQAADRSSAIQVPVLVHLAAGGKRVETPLVGAVCAALYLGADLLDNIADDELPAIWAGWPVAQIQLAASTYLAALPQLALSRFERTASDRATLWTLAREIAAELVTMCSGQHLDLALEGKRDSDLVMARTVPEQKGGAELRLFARIAATLAGASATRAAAFGQYGFALGTAGQIATDAADIRMRGASRDLLNGKRTTPIVHALTTLTGERRERLEVLLAMARRRPDAHDGVRAVLEAAGSLDYTLAVVEDYRGQARRNLADADPLEPAAGGLLALLDELG